MLFNPSCALAAAQSNGVGFLAFFAGCRRTRSGIDYSGAISRTATGRTCQRWDVQSPHAHGYTTTTMMMTTGEGLHQQQHQQQPQEQQYELVENYCRNPDPWDSTGPWCYTTDPDVRWEYCHVPFCGISTRNIVYNKKHS